MPEQTLEALTEQKTKLLLEREIAQTQVELNQLVRMAEQGRVVMEAWGDLIDPRERLYDDPTFAPGTPAMPFSTREDRKDGKYRPVFETEQDLSVIRGACHVLSTAFSSGINILDNLNNYTIAQGFEHKVEPADKNTPNPGLEAACQRVIDVFMDDNDWKADLEREIHHRSREDGEALVVLRPFNGWHTRVQLVEPDQLTAPADTRQLEDWIYNAAARLPQSELNEDYAANWSFGVHTRTRDVSRPLGFHVVYDGAGMDWDYFLEGDVQLAMQMGTGVLEFIKRNVPRNVKRGVADFYPVLKHIQQNEDLLDKTEKGAAVQAAIAFIREHMPTATSSQIENLRATNATDLFIQPVGKTVNGAGAGATMRYKQKFPPGTIIDTNGTKYQYGPMGQSSAPNFIAVIQAAFRYVGARWQIPEYMISSDASNNNFASILVAGSPFVQARQADQRFYVSRFQRIIWKVLRIAFEGGYFKACGCTWDQLETAINITTTPPDISIADELKATQIKMYEKNMGIVSTETLIEESGRDLDKEKQRLAEEQQQAMAQAEQQMQQQAAMGMPQQQGFGGNPQQQQPGQQQPGNQMQLPGQQMPMMESLSPADRLQQAHELIWGDYPIPVLEQFCPTGEGGDTDNSCGNEGSGFTPPTTPISVIEFKKHLNEKHEMLGKSKGSEVGRKQAGQRSRKYGDYLYKQDREVFDDLYDQYLKGKYSIESGHQVTPK